MPDCRNNAASRLWVVAALAASFVVCGCPTYETSYSGTYREVFDEAERSTDALEVDFFRFGDNAAAVVRLYDRDPITGDPFGEESYCVWTTASDFDEEEGDFRLDIASDSAALPEGQLLGEVLGDEQMRVSFYEDGTDQPLERVDELELLRHDTEPNSDCEMPEDFLVAVEFPRPANGRLQTMPDSADYDIQNPVLAITWLGVQSTETGQLAAVNRHQPAELLDDGLGTNFVPEEHGLRSERPVSIPPPPEVVRMPSGDTTIALGHFAVVDDDPDDAPADGESRDDWQFSWNTSEEKLVATPLQRATRPACDEAVGPGRTNRWGNALLFVEDDLTDVSRKLARQITGLDRCQQRGECDESFYIVDICASDDHVLHIFLREEYNAVPRVPLLVTDDYLEEESIPLPLINPFAL